MSAETLDLMAGWASLILTLFIFSYLLSDNLLYRIAVSILVGVTAAYVAIIAVESVIIPWVELTIFAGAENVGFRILGIIPFLLASALLVKGLPRFAPWGNVGIAFVIGVGVGVGIVGAVVGTIVPLVRDAAASFEDQSFFNGAVLSLGTITTLIYFQYIAQRDVEGNITRSLPMRILAGMGKAFLMITLGAIYGGIILTSLSVFSGVVAEQLAFILERIG